MAREDDRRLAEMSLDLWRAYVANGSLEEESFRRFQELARDEHRRLVLEYRPWVAAHEDEAARAKTLTDRYKEVFGADPEDPAHLAKIAEGIRKHEEAQRAAQAETDEERVARLIRDRDLARMKR
jgi:hypothetical protein